jgi:hypothetical protein
MARLDKQYYNWLKSLNEGDPVAVRCGDTYTITTIETITGWDRQIKVKSNCNIYTEGENHDELFNTEYLEPITFEAKIYVYRSHLIRRINDLDPEKLTNDQLEALCELIDSFGQ